MKKSIVIHIQHAHRAYLKERSIKKKIHRWQITIIVILLIFFILNKRVIHEGILLPLSICYIVISLRKLGLNKVRQCLEEMFLDYPLYDEFISHVKQAKRKKQLSDKELIFLDTVIYESKEYKKIIKSNENGK